MLTRGARGALVWLDRWSERVRLAATLLVVVIAGPLALHYRDRIRFADEAEYLAIARNIAHGHGFSITGHLPTAYRPPALPLLLAPFRLIGFPVTSLRLINVALLGGTVWMAWTLANALAGRAAAALAAMASALYPLQVFTASTFYPETLATTLLLGATLAVVRADAAEDLYSVRRLLAICALLFAALTLAVPQFAVAAVVCLGWYAWRHRAEAIETLTLAVVLVVLPLAAWSGRNALQMHAFVPGTTSTGYNLLLGNSEHTTYGSGVNTDVSRYEAVAAARRLDEVGRNRYFQSSALRYIEHHPGRALVLWAEKSLNYFSAANKLNTKSESSPVRDRVAGLTYYPLLLVLACRLILWRRFPIGASQRLLVALYVVMAPAMALFFTRVRFRVPLDEFLLVLVAVGVVEVVAAKPWPRASLT